MFRGLLSRVKSGLQRVGEALVTPSNPTDEIRLKHRDLLQALERVHADSGSKNGELLATCRKLCFEMSAVMREARAESASVGAPRGDDDDEPVSVVTAVSEYMMESGFIRILCDYATLRAFQDIRRDMLGVVIHTLLMDRKFLPLQSVHSAVGKLLEHAARNPHGDYMRLCCVISRQILEAPEGIVSFFFRRDAHTPFPLVTAVVPFLQDVQHPGTYARRCILYLLRKGDAEVNSFIQDCKGVEDAAVEGIVASLGVLPQAAPDSTAEWERIHGLADHLRMFLRFMADLVSEAPDAMRGRLLRRITVDILADRLHPALIQSEENAAATASIYAALFVASWTQEPLATLMAEFLLGDEAARPEPVGGDTRPILRYKLIKRIDDNSNWLAVATMRLFSSLLALQSEHVLCNLVLRNLQPNLEVDQRLCDLSFFSSMFPAPLSKNDTSVAAYREAAAMSACHAVSRFPLWSQSARSPCVTPVKRPPGGVDSRSEPAYEGLFLEVILNRLLGLMSNPFVVNAALTGLVAELAASPHPILHHYFFNAQPHFLRPMRSFADTVREVTHSVNTSLSLTASEPSDGASHLESEIKSAQRRLADDTPGGRPDHGRPSQHAQLVDALIVLEEFRKEMLAIAEQKVVGIDGLEFELQRNAEI